MKNQILESYNKMNGVLANTQGLTEFEILENYFKPNLNEGMADQASALISKVKKKFGSLTEPADPKQLNQAAQKLKKVGGEGFLNKIGKRFGKSVTTLGIVLALSGALAGGANASQAEEFLQDITQVSQSQDSGSTGEIERNLPDGKSLQWDNPDSGNDPSVVDREGWSDENMPVGQYKWDNPDSGNDMLARATKQDGLRK